MIGVFTAVLVRDLRVAFRRWSELAHPLIFFIIVITLFPLALSATASQLRDIGVGVLWVATFLSSLLAVDGLEIVWKVRSTNTNASRHERARHSSAPTRCLPYRE